MNWFSFSIKLSSECSEPIFNWLSSHLKKWEKSLHLWPRPQGNGDDNDRLIERNQLCDESVGCRRKSSLWLKRFFVIVSYVNSCKTHQSETPAKTHCEWQNRIVSNALFLVSHEKTKTRYKLMRFIRLGAEEFRLCCKFAAIKLEHGEHLVQWRQKKTNGNAAAMKHMYFMQITLCERWVWSLAAIWLMFLNWTVSIFFKYTNL